MFFSLLKQTDISICDRMTGFQGVISVSVCIFMSAFERKNVDIINGKGANEKLL